MKIWLEAKWRNSLKAKWRCILWLSYVFQCVFIGFFWFALSTIWVKCFSSPNIHQERSMQGTLRMITILHRYQATAKKLTFVYFCILNFKIFIGKIWARHLSHFAPQRIPQLPPLIHSSLDRMKKKIVTMSKPPNVCHNQSKILIPQNFCLHSRDSQYLATVSMFFPHDRTLMCEDGGKAIPQSLPFL